MANRQTAAELIRVPGYPKFRLSKDDRKHPLADYLPWCEAVVVPDLPPDVPQCRDPSACPFLELAVASKADVVVTGDSDFLVLSTGFSVPKSSFRLRSKTELYGSFPVPGRGRKGKDD